MLKTPNFGRLKLAIGDSRAAAPISWWRMRSPESLSKYRREFLRQWGHDPSEQLQMDLGKAINRSIGRPAFLGVDLSRSPDRTQVTIVVTCPPGRNKAATRNCLEAEARRRYLGAEITVELL